MAAGGDNFTLLRLALALAVVVSHAFSVTTGRVEDEPLTALTGFTLGEHAVNGFFAISGFLVTMSYDRRGWRDYVVARALRIAPGLIVAVLVVALVMGAALTRLPLGEYVADGRLWRFISGTLTSFKSTAPLPGVFEQNPFHFPMGTVWTLKYEVFCYFGVLLIGLSGLLNSKRAGLALLIVLGIAIVGQAAFWPDAGKGTETMLRLPFIFALGGAIYLWRETLPASFVYALALLVAAFITMLTPAYTLALYVASAYGVIILAFAPGPLRLYEPKADLSYGTYLYGWPIQQALHALFPAASALALLAPSIFITLAVAAASWFAVEKPALAIKKRLVKPRPDLQASSLVAP